MLIKRTYFNNGRMNVEQEKITTSCTSFHVLVLLISHYNRSTNKNRIFLIDFLSIWQRDEFHYYSDDEKIVNSTPFAGES